MRIDAYNQVSQLYKTTKSKKVSRAKETGSAFSFEVSQTAKDYQIAKKAVSEASDVREDKVAKIKNALASGSYNVSAAEVADKMVSKYFDSLF